MTYISFTLITYYIYRLVSGENWFFFITFLPSCWLRPTGLRQQCIVLRSDKTHAVHNSVNKYILLQRQHFVLSINVLLNPYPVSWWTDHKQVLDHSLRYCQKGSPLVPSVLDPDHSILVGKNKFSNVTVNNFEKCTMIKEWFYLY